MSSVVVLIPIYKPELDPWEQYSLDVSMATLGTRLRLFIGPQGLDLHYYAERYPGIDFVGFDAQSFASIPGYNRLLLAAAFYETFAAHEFMLIQQTDAIVLRDELDWWCAQPYDYVGAPWPDGVELFVNLGRFEGERGRRVRAMVGNGGFSLRRIRKQLALLREFPEAVDYFMASGSSEDLFFSFMGALSSDFVLPNEITASRFSLELKPALYHAINGGQPPMGGHAWWKYDLPFWRALLPGSPGAQEIGGVPPPA